MVESELTKEDLQAVRKLRDEKYDTWEWVFGHTIDFTYHNKVRWDGGSLEVQVNVARGGEIQEIRFYGDFLSLTPLTKLEQALSGVRFRKEDVKAVLDQYAMNELFGPITEEEVLETMFPGA